MTETDKLLEELGFRKEAIVEAILVTRNTDGSPNAAPMGVRRTGPTTIEIKPFKTSATYGNLRAASEAVINVSSDPLHYLLTAFKDEDLAGFKKTVINPDLIIEGADATVSIENLKECEGSQDRGCFVGRAALVEVHRGLPSVFSRGRAEAIEAVIHATRIRVFLERGCLGDAEILYNKFADSKGVVGRVSSPHSAEARVVEALEGLIEGWRKRASR